MSFLHISCSGAKFILHITRHTRESLHSTSH
jgi:hypothetical protein